MADDEIIQGESLPVETKGKWQPFEYMTRQTFELGKTYKIKIKGVCELAVSKDKPTSGLKTNEIEYTKTEGADLWVRTKGE